MRGKPSITIVGAGRLGTALATQLHSAGYPISSVVSGHSATSRQKTRSLARKIGSRAETLWNAKTDSDLVWFCVPDGQISRAAEAFKSSADWKGRFAFHSSGALPSDELQTLRAAGASVAAVHPFMTFVRGAAPSLKGVSFGVEGDAAAVMQAGKIVHSLGGSAFPIRKNNKAAYHAWGGFTSPLLVALFITGEQVAKVAGISANDARKKMMPIIRQTLRNYEQLGPAVAFTGPLVRGDAEVVRKHLHLLRKLPLARDVYIALARSALKNLPVRNRTELKQVLSGRRGKQIRAGRNARIRTQR